MIKLEILNNWVVKTWKLPGEGQKEEFTSEIYAEIGGELAEVAYVPLVLTPSDHEALKAVENKYRALREELTFKALGQDISKLNWIKRLAALLTGVVNGNDPELSKLFKAEQREHDQVYAKRRSYELHETHLHLIIAAPRMYRLLKQIQEKGQLFRVDLDELQETLRLAEGEITPVAAKGKDD